MHDCEHKPKRVNRRAYALALRSTAHLLDMGNLQAASNILENYLAAYPHEPGILRRLGKIRIMQGRPREAAGLLEQALMLASNQVPVTDAA